MRELYEELTSPAAVRQLRLPEGLSLEYKSRVPRTKSLAKDCCAFANTIGGMVIIGVEDPPQEGAVPSEFPGVPADSDPVRIVDGMLSNSIVPRIEYESRAVFFADDGEERCYVAVWVEPSGELHQVSIEDVGTCYRRVGRHSVPMGPEEIRQRVEAISRSSRRLEDRIEEQLSKMPNDQAFVYTVVAPDLPFASPVLDPSDPSFRQQITEQTRILTLAREVEPYSRGCQSISAAEDVFMKISVSRDGVCEFADGRVMNAAEAFVFWNGVLFNQYSQGFVARVPMDSKERDTLGNQVRVEHLIVRLLQFLNLCITALKLMDYEGRLQIRTLLVPAEGSNLVLKIPYHGSEREKMIAGERVSAGVIRTVLDVERQKVDTIRDLVLKMFQTFGADDLSTNVKYSFEQLTK